MAQRRLSGRRIEIMGVRWGIGKDELYGAVVPGNMYMVTQDLTIFYVRKWDAWDPGPAPAILSGNV
jgi:hypothetical protein